MNVSSPRSFADLPRELVEAVNDHCDRFERAWRDGGSPDLEGALAGSDPAARRVLLHELGLIDAAYRRRYRLPVDLEDYRRRHTDLDTSWLGERLPAPDDTMPLPVSTRPELPDFEVLDEIGRGGMGVVYQARDLRLQRLVCLKVLTPESAVSHSRMARLRQEAHVISALNHPNICTIYALEEWQGLPVLVLEWIDGRTLRAFARNEVRVDRLIPALAQAARALAAAHQAGVVHRDVKPENVMIRPDGLVKLLDFGVARVSDSSGMPRRLAGSSTSSGTIVGTLRYMSPEQSRGVAVDAASDAFSFGVLLYEALTGRHPFPGESSGAVPHAIQCLDPTPPAELVVGVDPGLSGLTMRLLSKHPIVRPSLAEAADQLGASRHPASPAWQSVPAAAAPARPVPVGRDQQLVELRRAFEAAGAGKGSMLCVSGEPGIGKTTIVEQFVSSVVEQGSGFAMSGRCSQRLATADAYVPILDALEDLTENRWGGEALRLLGANAPAWYDMVASRDSDTGVATAGQPLSQGRLLREFRAFLEALTRQRPLVLFLDDVHWADESTVDLLGYLCQDVAALRVLVVTTHRPTELAIGGHPFGRLRLDLKARGTCHDLPLPLWSKEEVSSYLASRYPGSEFPADFLDVLFRQTEGSPLFVTGLLSYLEEREVLVRHDRRWLIDEQVPDLSRALPDTISCLIERKLSYLPPEDRRLLQVASVEGVEFDSVVVADVAEADRAEVEERLQALEKVHGLVQARREREYPDGTPSVRYRFVHILYQNALYNGLTPSRRAAWSLAVARRLEGLWQGKARDIASQLAFLFEAAREYRRAADWIVQTAQDLAVMAACRKAADRCMRGLELLAKLPPSEDRDRQEFHLQFSLGFAQSFTRGYDAAETIRAYTRAEELSPLVAEGESSQSVLQGLWIHSFVRSDEARQRSLLARALDHAERSGDPLHRIVANGNAAASFLHFGELESARHHFQAVWGVEDASLVVDRRLLSRMCVPTVTLCRGLGAWLCWLTGRIDDALAFGRISLDRTERLGAPQFRVQAFHFHSVIHYLQGDAASALTWAHQTVRFSEQHDLPYYLGLGLAVRSWAEVHSGGGDLERMREEVSERLRIIDAQLGRGALMSVPFMLGSAGESLARLGLFEKAAASLGRSLAVARGHGERALESQVLLRLADVHANAFGDAAGAEALLDEAIDTARRQGAKTFELRAGARLLRLRAARGLATAGAGADLAALLAAFEQGLDGPDIAEARAALDDC
ncbi:MAG: AAA family ATPase [Isosphaeraceae bacterium]